jgi:PAS domain S-box-containing protein
MSSTSDRTSGSRTALVFTVLIIAVLVIFAMTLTTYMSRSLERRTEEELSQQVNLLVNTMSSYHAALSESATKIAGVFRANFHGRFSLDPVKSVIVEGEITPLIKNGSIVINLNNTIVDRFTADTRAVGTVFVRSGNDFIRVTTSLKREDGRRAIGTFLEKNHPAYQGLLNGIGFVGKVELFGKDYMASCQPVKDDRGNVIAVLSVGLDFTDNLKGLKDKIRSTKIGRSGYMYVLDAKEGHNYGKLQIHPAKEGSNIVNAVDSDGRAFIWEILEKKDGIIRYPWINTELGETKIREKLVAYRYLKEWDWIICAGSWLDELNSEAKTLLNAIIGATTLITLVLVLLFRTMLQMENRLTRELSMRIDQYQESQEELQATEEMLREQVDKFIVTHDQLLASEEQLRVQLEMTEETSKKFKAIFDHSPITVGLTTIPESMFTEVNQAFVDVFGYSREEVIGKTSLALNLWLKDEDRNRYLQELRDNGYVHNFEAGMRSKGGKEIIVLFSGAFLEIAGKPCVLNTISEITEQKRLQNQLQQSQKLEVVGQLAGGIAHDFNNMLTGIMAAAELLKMRLPDDVKNHKMVDIIIDATARSADLTRELLTFSRKGTAALSPIRINDTITSVMSLLEHTIDKRIQHSMKLDSGNPVVMGDQSQLQNALLNLGVNARDAMPQGGTLTFATTEKMLDELSCRSMGITLEPGCYLEIAVSDTGLGMTKEVLEHIFEPFFTTKGVGKGTGLGLAAVYGTVKGHGGELAVQSQPGVGSIFKIFLPLLSDEPNERIHKDEAVFGNGGILLVDDEEMLRSVGSDLLEGLGYTVFLAEDGVHALEVFIAHRSEISLVILDMIMPKMGGAEAFLVLREQAPELKVLFCSGFSREGIYDELVGLGGSGFIQKPYNLIELSRTVAKAFEQE